ncbi:hypothetical protein OF83DRAFT_1176253 [Amylostereum chailletii]|nr:hypothetical protein OF83DRAFT_1176253 [Amylostereum chailletii]
MARILEDPTNEARPDFSEQHFEARRNAVVDGEDQDVAVARLNALWDSEHDERVAAWNVQQDEDRADGERQAAEAAAKPDDDAPDIPDFDEDAVPNPSRTSRYLRLSFPSQYSRSRLVRA